jgi:hypothetical protein
VSYALSRRLFAHRIARALSRIHVRHLRVEPAGLELVQKCLERDIGGYTPQHPGPGVCLEGAGDGAEGLFSGPECVVASVEAAVASVELVVVGVEDETALIKTSK